MGSIPYSGLDPRVFRYPISARRQAGKETIFQEKGDIGLEECPQRA
jgi:hypothetical protein